MYVSRNIFELFDNKDIYMNTWEYVFFVML